jgi:hypothetical protein
MNAFHPTASALVLGVSLLSACSSGDPAAKTPAPKPPEKTVFDPLVQTEQRARDVQKTVDENAERTRKAADAEERGDKSP